MKKAYQKPVVEIMDYLQQEMIATGSCSGFLRTEVGGPCTSLDYRDTNTPACMPQIPYEYV